MATFKQKVMRQFRPHESPSGSASGNSPGTPIDEKDAEAFRATPEPVVEETTVDGVARVEALQAVWGKNGKYLLWAGLAMMMIIFELDNSTVYNYQTFAASSFSQLSLLASIQTSQTIVSAVIKPPIAKISDVIGRGETYIFTILCYILSYILCASSANVGVYAGGAMFYAVGQSGTQILDQVIIADISTTRWRSFAIGLSYAPFLITPWVGAFIVDSVVAGIGWRWGIGMFAIIMPFGASFIVITLLYFGRKAKKAGLVAPRRITVYDFCSQIDLGGLILLSGGFAMLLLPITLAATSPSKWSTPWIDAVMAVGAVCLIALMPYEHYVSKNPILPPRYLKNKTIVFSCLLGAFDAMGFSGTHTYLLSWALVSHNLTVRNATFLIYVNGVVQCLFGIVTGWIMYKTRRYKWLTFGGVIIRIIGYGVMIRLRGQDNSIGELYGVQAIQGIGSGIVVQCVLVASQIVVSHKELAQISSLVLLFNFLGSAIGQAIAGAIYTNTLRERLTTHMPNASADTISTLYNSITGVLPEWGTPERDAVNAAYSDVLRYISIAALALSVPMLLFGLLLPDLKLKDKQNVMDEVDKNIHEKTVNETNTKSGL